MKSLLSKLFFVFFISFFFYSCEKEDNLIQGDWVRVNVDIVDSTVSEEWVFDNHNITIRRVDTETGVVLHESNGRYVVKPVFDRTYLDITDFEGGVFAHFDVEWVIFSLKSDKLILGHYADGGLFYRELVRP